MGMLDFFRRKAPAAASDDRGASVANIRPSGTGWAETLKNLYLPRSVNPHLYEALREAIAPIDGGINRLVTMDGILDIEGDNDTIVDELRDFVLNVPVNDLEQGLQVFADAMGNELYEQGLAVGEYIVDAKQRDIIGMRVADSKGILFQRDDGRLRTWYQPPSVPTGRGDGTDRAEQILRRTHVTAGMNLTSVGFSEVDPNRMIYFGLSNEADNPYGTSIMRSMEFVAQILIGIQNATKQTWSRYGDPPLEVVLNTKVKDTPEGYLKRAQILAADLGKVLTAKANGNSADFVRVLGADDKLSIKVIGAQDQIIEIEAPARHVLEQIVAKIGLPSWMLGFHWSTAERLAESQGILVLQESQTRFARRKPGLKRMLETLLRMRGWTWKKGAWDLVQRLPNLSDELKKAQAAFLRAQTELMLSGVITPAATPASKALQESMVKIAAKLAGLDDRAKAELLADPLRMDALILDAL